MAMRVAHDTRTFGTRTSGDSRVRRQGAFMIDDTSAPVIRVEFKPKPRRQFALRREMHRKRPAVLAAEPPAAPAPTDAR